ncbi:MAG TPA: hypothetical protein VFK39_15005 [Gemmatimonadaceae bacterium]|nr:hypothetical protein [Gemmatimonadaceae bacterium]
MRDRTGTLPEWALAELRRPVATSDILRERVMARVRADGGAHVGTPGGRSVRITARPAVARLALRHPFSGALLALAASVAWLAFGSTIVSSRYGIASVPATPAGRMIVLGDTVDSALHDTLRLVRFVLHAPGAARVSIAGDFNGWSRTSTPLAYSAGSGVWSAVVALDRTSREYAFVVDDTQWVQPDSTNGGAAGSTPVPATPLGGDST